MHSLALALMLAVAWPRWLRCTSRCTLQQREGEKNRNIEEKSFGAELVCDADPEREDDADGGGDQLGGGDYLVREAEALDAVAAAVVGRVLRVDSKYSKRYCGAVRG